MRNCTICFVSDFVKRNLNMMSRVMLLVKLCLRSSLEDSKFQPPNKTTFHVYVYVYHLTKKNIMNVSRWKIAIVTTDHGY